MSVVVNREFRDIPDWDISEFLLAEQVRLVLRRLRADHWPMHVDDFWCYVQPLGYQPREQGWKLHVSATPLSAVLVTLRAAEVLVRNGCAFKVVVGLPQLHEQVSVNADRGFSGKVITAYPADDEQFVRLAEELHRVTEHLPGPAILSDRPYRPGSLVHYRYGVFTGRTVLSNDGSYESMLIAPDGGLVKDRRLAWFSPPQWAACPLDDEAHAAPQSAGPVLLADRFVVRQAILHGNKGGVYLGAEQATGEEVVIKQARPHIGAMLDGTDARDRLRHEAALLGRLAPLGLTPRPVQLFEQQGHLFLAQERIPGITLAAWVSERVERSRAEGEDVIGLGEALSVARQLVTLIDAVHAEGLVVRDLSPGNLMITPEGAVRLVDLEFVAVPGAQEPVAGTPGYAAPEQMDGVGLATGLAPAPEQTADLYSLGALLLFLTSGVDPALAPDRPARRTTPERLAHLVQVVARSNAATRALAPAILGLLVDQPERRWALDQVGKFLDCVGSRGPVRVLPASDQLSRPAQEALLADGLAYLAETMRPAASDWLWPMGEEHAESDPRNVQHGAGGIPALLAQAASVLGDPTLAEAARTAATWLADQLTAGERLLPGLYFGASGTLWALYDTARLLGDGELAAQALTVAAKVPVVWPNPDICHGTAGAGLAQLHLWQATGDDRFGARVRDCADSLLSAATWRAGGVCWPIPDDFDSELAGRTHYGFAHGIAGIGAFLLAAGQATGDRRYLQMAGAAGEALAAAVHWDGKRAWWPIGEEPDPAEPVRMAHWCSGSSGVGTFLIRLWQATGADQYRKLAEGAARAVRSARWHMSTSHCHGLAGDGQFLLDLADLLGETRYHIGAEELAACLEVRAVYRDGQLVVPDSSGDEVSASYGAGLAGVLSFLLRLRHGGPRPWMVDTCATGAQAGPLPGAKGADR